MSAATAGLMACGHCGQVMAHQEGPIRCPFCGGAVRPRKPASLSRSWALLLTAIILYVPANLLPIMQTSSLFGSSRDTIIGGVEYFWHSGSPGLAILIFTVSILVPVLKMAILGLLALTVQFGWPLDRRQCILLYHVIEFVGRWSMLDVFVVALMVGLVRFKGVAVIEAGPAISGMASGAATAYSSAMKRSLPTRSVSLRNSVQRCWSTSATMAGTATPAPPGST